MYTCTCIYKYTHIHVYKTVAWSRFPEPEGVAMPQVLERTADRSLAQEPVALPHLYEPSEVAYPGKVFKCILKAYVALPKHF